VYTSGSLNLRLGLGSSSAPTEVKHVVAYVRRLPAPPRPWPAPLATVTEAQEVACRQARADPAPSAVDAGSPLAAQLEKQLRLPAPPPASVSAVEPDAGPSEWEATSAEGEEPLFGEAALRLSPAAAARRHLVWPLRAGRLHVTAEQPLSVVREALGAVWRWAAVDALGLAPDTLRSLHAVLVLPARASSRDTAEMASVLLRVLCCRSLVVHMESSAVAAAVASPLACVVSLGAHSAYVCCLEDGVEVEESRETLGFGCEELAAALPSLARRSGGAWPASDASLAAPFWPLLTPRLLGGLTHASSAAAPPPQGLEVTAARLALPGGASALVRLGSAALLAPLALFRPALLGREDEGLDRAVARSVAAAAAGRPELRARLLGAILLTGGGAPLPGLAEALAALAAQCAADDDPDAAPPAAFASLARPDPRFVAWRGGALLASVDTTRDGWVTRESWAEGVAVGRPGRHDASMPVTARLNTYAHV